MDRNIVKILGFGVDTYTFEDALNYISSHHGQVITINPEMIIEAEKNTEFANIINSSEMVIPDGIGVQMGLKILGANVKRIAGIEFGKALLQKYAQEDKKIAMVGARKNIIELAISKLKGEIPNLNIVYNHDGYFENDDVIISAVANSKADLVLVALGSPKQEFFISRLKKELPDAVMIGLGGSFDVWAGVVQRAPIIYQKLGLEWLYRTIKEPKRLRRIFPTLPLFIFRVMKERLFRK